MIKAILVDDEIWTRKSIKAFGNWDKYGITIAGEASDGEEGMRLIKEIKPQIVITDMNMPGMNGVQLLKILMEKYPHIKVIVVSGYSDFEYAKQALKSRAVDYILKPVDAEELNMALEKSVNAIKSSDNTSAYDLARPMDKKIVALIMEEKKIIQRLLSEGNTAGISSTLNRLYKNVAVEGSGEISTGKFIYKILREAAEEQLILMDEGSENGKGRKLSREPAEVKGNSLLEYFKAAEDMLKQSANEIGEHTRNKEGSTLPQVKKYIELHYTEHISLDSLASLFFVSKEYLSKAFKAKYQKNLMNYITELRMEKAKLMLESKDISIKNAAQAVGYEDLSHFYRVFKTYYGMSPGEMRKEV